MSDVQLLAIVPIFSDLSLSVLDRLLSRMTKRSFSENSMILMEDEFGDTFFLIGAGRVKITRVREDGKEVIFSVLGEGEFFGEMSLLDKEPRSANAIAIEDSDVLILKRRDFLTFLEEYPKITLSLLGELASRIRKSDELIESLSLSDAEHRIGTTLVRLAEEYGIIRKGVVEISKLPYQQDIANMVGTTRETVSRMMKLLKEKGMIQLSGHRHHLSILDYTQFKRTFG